MAALSLTEIRKIGNLLSIAGDKTFNFFVLEPFVNTYLRSLQCIANLKLIPNFYMILQAAVLFWGAAKIWRKVPQTMISLLILIFK